MSTIRRGSTRASWRRSEDATVPAKKFMRPQHGRTTRQEQWKKTGRGESITPKQNRRGVKGENERKKNRGRGMARDQDLSRRGGQIESLQHRK